MPLRTLSQLEDTVKRTAELLRGLQAENAGLKEEIKKIREDLEELRRERKGHEETRRHQEQIRRQIRVLVEKAIKNLSVLEEDLG